jgi:DNA-binding NtrC family response regulator
MKAGAVDFIEKPFDDERLFGAIEEALTMSERSARKPRDGRANWHAQPARAAGSRMLDRLGVRSLAEAIRLAVLATLAPAALPAGQLRDHDLRGIT